MGAAGECVVLFGDVGALCVAFPSIEWVFADHASWARSSRELQGVIRFCVVLFCWTRRWLGVHYGFGIWVRYPVLVVCFFLRVRHKVYEVPTFNGAPLFA